MKQIILMILVLALLAGCTTLTAEQKKQIAEQRTKEIIDANHSAIGNNESAKTEIMNQYNY
jgi:hypothetical protein